MRRMEACSPWDKMSIEIMAGRDTLGVKLPVAALKKPEWFLNVVEDGLISLTEKGSLW